MRILLAFTLLCSLLVACTKSNPPVERPSHAEVSALYLVLSSQAAMHKALYNAAHGVHAESVIATFTDVAQVMHTSDELLRQDFSPSLSAHVQAGKIQLSKIRDISKRWIVQGIITADEAQKELQAIDAEATLGRYTKALNKLGWTDADIAEIHLELALADATTNLAR